jgi:hypothetical protein
MNTFGYEEVNRRHNTLSEKPKAKQADLPQPGSGVHGENLSPKLRNNSVDFPSGHAERDGLLDPVEELIKSGLPPESRDEFAGLPTTPGELISQLTSPPREAQIAKDSPLESLPMTISHAEIARLGNELANRGHK